MYRKFFSILIIFISLSNLTDAQVFYRSTRIDINSPISDEMAPAMYKNGVVFSSNRKSEVILTTVDQEGNYTYNLYFAEQKSSRNWSSPGLFSRELSSRYNESSACFSADGNTVYFTATYNAEGNIGDASGDTLKNGIFIATRIGDKWSEPESFPYNNEEYDLGHPSISEDGTRLFFASRDPSGFGKYDLYYSELVNGNWSKPFNLGPAINTSESEVFPFIYKNNRLYFSSSGHQDRNDLEIYYTDHQDGGWTKPVALPRPFNSRSDDFALVANAEMDTGYFVSSRRGTDDIYFFTSAFPAFSSCPEQVDETFCYDFYEAGSMDLDTTTLAYEWDLGDGTKIRNVRASHCYAEPGYYLIQLNVIDTLTGDVYFSEATYDLLIEPLEQPYMLSPDTVRVNQNVNFDASQSIIRSFTKENYYWDFGDGSVENEVETRHRYTRRGEYTVRLGITGSSEDQPGTSQKACASKKIVVLAR